MDLPQKIKAKTLQIRDSRRIAKDGFPVVHRGPAGAPRALLMYLSQPLTWAEKDPRLNWHENQRQSRQIAEVLVECGYQVDVADLRDDRFVPDGEYQLFIGHGSNAGNIAALMGNETRKICLATGQYGPYANRNVEKRYRELEQRKQIQIEYRMPSKANPAHYKVFDEIACFGNHQTIDTFSPLEMAVHSFVNYPNPNINFVRRDYMRAKRGFVYIAAQLHVLKGLDLLIEIFSRHPDFHLYVCGKIDSELAQVYKSELSAAKNIHTLGYVQMGGRKWKDICSQSAWYISPSCSDSCQGAALNAMAAGLIPILSQDVGVDLYNAGIRLPDCSIQTVENVVGDATTWNPKLLRTEERRVVKTVYEKYNSDAFGSDWETIINEVDMRSCS
jgi:glycosyltransferase involved in cell wall biosynthesis